MNALIQKIHIAKNQLGLEDDTYRDLATRITGKSSSKAMTEGERQKLLAEMERLGFKATSKGNQTRLEGRYLPKIQALWISGYNLGVITNGTDEALEAFVKRETEIDSTRWLHKATDADKVIKALRGWLTRSAGVDWKKDKDLPDWANQPWGQVVLAQWRVLTAAGKTADCTMRDTIWNICGHTGEPKISNMTYLEWQKVMKVLGQRIRKAK